MNGRAWIGSVEGVGGVVADARVAVADRAFLHGEGLFETMRVLDDGRVPLLPLHLERLADGAARFGWAAPARAVVERAVAELCVAEGMHDGVVRLTLSAGTGAPVVVLVARPRGTRAGALRIAVVAARRDPGDPTAELKTTSRAFWALAQFEAQARGADEALVLSAAGTLAETTTGNLFLRIGGRLCTPARDGTFLPGVARRVLLAALGSDADERPIAEAELARAAAIWVTNAVHGARPAVLVAGGPGAAADDPLGEAFARALTGGGLPGAG